MRGEAERSLATEWILLALGAGIAFAFAHLGFRAHKQGLDGDAAIARRLPRASALWGDAWGVDRAYASWIVQPVKLAGFLIAVVVDQFAIDGLVNGTAALAKAAGNRTRRMADGNIATYALWIGGVTASIAIFWIWWGGS